MKLIHVAGRSNADKRTFIHELLERLNSMGTTAMVKHTMQNKTSEKDTYQEESAAFSVGIGDNKATAAIQNKTLPDILTMLCDAGVNYVIINGFKNQPFPKIIIGNNELENCVIRDPTVDEVIRSLDRFEDFHTIQEIVHQLREECNTETAGCILTFNGIVREITEGERTEYLDFDENIQKNVLAIKAEMEKVPGILGVKFHHRTGRLYAGEDITYIAVMAEHRQEAFSAMSDAIDRMKDELHNFGKELTEN